MKTALSANAIPKIKPQTNSAGNTEFALGTAFGISFGFLGLLMACVEYFSADAAEARIINQGAIKFIIIAVPSLLIGLYGLYKIRNAQKHL